jgi:hypothetical protein
MLRWFALALLLANALFWAFTHGWLASVGLKPADERDPSRWEQQVRPDRVRVLPPAVAASAIQEARGAATAALVCLESESIAAESIDAAEQALVGAVPERGWIRASREVPAQYAVVIGPLAGREAQQKKSEELRRLRVTFEALALPGERDSGVGYSLGAHATREAAQAALDAFVKRGVRTARVVQLRAAGTEQRLRFENATPEQAAALRGVKAPALGASGMQPCGSAAQGAR